MVVAAGYKQTEVGTIPEDWKLVPLESTVLNGGLVRGPFGGALKKEFFVERGYKVYEQRNAIYGTADKGSYFIDESKYKELARFQVQPGDFIVSCSGTIGSIYQIPEGAPEGVINQALLKISLDSNRFNQNYFLAVFRSKSFQERIKDNAHGGAMQNLVGMDVFRKTLLPFPPTLVEQRAIAAALSDADALIESLEQLLAKKRAVKQGAMQELLTGRRRLPGFSGEWEVKKLGELATFHKGKGLSKSLLDPFGTQPCIHYGELFTLYPEIIQGIISRTNSSAGYFRSIANDVLMPTSDVTPTGLAKASCLTHSDVILGGDILVIRAHANKVYGPFLSYIIRYEQEQILQLVTGTTVFHLYAGDMKNFVFALPPIEEQTAIAAVLSDMDAEIDALEAKLAKAREVKQGMIQELLTGRTRLV